MKLTCKLLVVFIVAILSLVSVYLHFKLSKTNKPSTSKCPDTNIVTVIPVVRLYGNKYKMVAYFPELLKSKMEYLFQGINIRGEIDLSRHCRMRYRTIIVHLNETVDHYEQYLQEGNVNLQLAKYSARYEDVLTYGMQEIQKDLRFHPKYINHSQKILRKLRAAFMLEGKNAVFIGMHYRGTDYREFLTRTYAGPLPIPSYTYYINAMNYLKARYKHAIFILVSIDMMWMKQNVPTIKKKYKRLVVNPNAGDHIQDLVLLAQCNHSIINYGTFGVISALFSGGTTFSYDLKIPLDHRGPTVAMGIANHLNNWHLLR